MNYYDQHTFVTNRNLTIMRWCLTIGGAMILGCVIRSLLF
jgi:hypothetical protein